MIMLSEHDINVVFQEDHPHQEPQRPNYEGFMKKIQKVNWLLILKLLFESKQRQEVFQDPMNRNFLNTVKRTLDKTNRRLISDFCRILGTYFYHDEILGKQEIIQLVEELLEPKERQRSVIKMKGLMERCPRKITESSEMVRTLRQCMDQNQWSNQYEILKLLIKSYPESMVIINHYTQRRYASKQSMVIVRHQEQQGQRLPQELTIVQVQDRLNIQNQRTFINEDIRSLDKVLISRLDDLNTVQFVICSESLLKNSKFIIKEFAERESKNDRHELNPFNLRNMRTKVNQGQRLNLHLMLLSKTQLSKIELKLKNQVFEIQDIMESFYQNIHITFCTFSIPLPVNCQQDQFTLKMVAKAGLSGIFKKSPDCQKKLCIRYCHAVCRNYLIVEQNEQLRQIDPKIMTEVMQYGLFSSIEYFLRTNRDYEANIGWLKLLFDRIQRNRLKQHVNNILKKLVFSIPIFQSQSKYVAYLLFSVFRQNPITYCLACDLHKKLKFDSKTILQTLSENYSNDLRQIDESYKMCYLIQLIFKGSAQVISSKVFEGLRVISEQRRYLILEILLYNRPDLFNKVGILDKVQEQFKINDFLNVIKYTKLHALWLVNHLNKSIQTQKFVIFTLQLLDRAIALGAQKQGEQIEELTLLAGMTSLILKRFQMNQHAATIQLLERAKKLAKVSNGKMHILRQNEYKLTFLTGENVLHCLGALFQDQISVYDEARIFDIFQAEQDPTRWLEELIKKWRRECGQQWVGKFYQWMKIYLKKSQITQQQISNILRQISILQAYEQNKQIVISIIKEVVQQKIQRFYDVDQKQSIKSLRRLLHSMIYRMVNQNIFERVEAQPANEIRRFIESIYPEKTIQFQTRKLMLYCTFEQIEQ